jgi:hypothetical protein
VTRSDTTGVEPSAVEKAEIAGLGGNLIWYRGARGDGYSHGECVEIARAGGNLIWYRGARDVGASHGECVDALRLGGNLSDYQWAREVDEESGGVPSWLPVRLVGVPELVGCETWNPCRRDRATA